MNSQFFSFLKPGAWQREAGGGGGGEWAQQIDHTKLGVIFWPVKVLVLLTCLTLLSLGLYGITKLKVQWSNTIGPNINKSHILCD